MMLSNDPRALGAWSACATVRFQQPSFSASAARWKRDVIYLGSQAIAEVDASGVHELHSDHLGTPLFITVGAGRPSAGTIEGRQVFGAYGESLINEGYIPLTGYTGHIQTDDTGLIYMRARYYSPQWHRFLNSDQGVDEAQMNQFAYVNGSPVSLR